MEREKTMNWRILQPSTCVRAEEHKAKLTDPTFRLLGDIEAVVTGSRSVHPGYSIAAGGRVTASPAGS